jgi:integrase
VEVRRPRGRGRRLTSRDLELIRLGERLGLALDIVGISPRSTMSVRDPVLHVLRHTFGSRLARKGVSRLKIARLMSNSPLIARKLYINLVPEEMADEVAF